MTQIFKLFLTVGRLRALALAGFSFILVACDSGSSIGPDAGSTPEAVPAPSDVPPAGSPSPAPPSPAPPSPAPPSPEPSTPTAGGIPLGVFHLRSGDFDGPYNGALRQAWPSNVMRNLAAIQARGGRVILSLSGEQRFYKDAKGHFSLAKWKARIDRFRGMDFRPYIEDGTLLGHYLIDEPYDAHNFGGQPVGGALVEEMAKYSKEIWPDLATIVRAEPYRVQWSGTFKYLDAGWAQYAPRYGEVRQYIAKTVSYAQSMGLALVVGLNLRDGGVGNNRLLMTGGQILEWGSALLSGSEPCAFISWKYDATYLARSDVHAAMQSLSDMARNRPSKACHSG